MKECSFLRNFLTHYLSSRQLSMCSIRILPRLILYHTENIDEDLVKTIFKFSGVTRVLSPSRKNYDSKLLHEDVENLFIWSKRQGITFNSDKCNKLLVTIHFPRKRTISHS